mgnify:FL=1
MIYTNVITPMVDNLKGKFFTVYFETLDGTVRKYNGSIVSDGITDKGCVTMKTKRGYKRFYLNRVIQFKGNGFVIKPRLPAYVN